LRLYRIEEFADIIDIPNTPENGEETDGEQLNDSTEEMMMDTSLNETALISTSQRRSLLVPDGLDEFLNDDSDNVDETVRFLVFP
jgi:hypothetical protein